jgi:hypothetical protein
MEVAIEHSVRRAPYVYMYINIYVPSALSSAIRGQRSVKVQLNSPNRGNVIGDQNQVVGRLGALYSSVVLQGNSLVLFFSSLFRDHTRRAPLQ